jgi:ubiquinone/menaquinone biosynthesis C-methylase UbiE
VAILRTRSRGWSTTSPVPSSKVLSSVGLESVLRRGLVTGDRASSQYLDDSILSIPDPPTLAAQPPTAGFERMGWQALSWGIVAVHQAYRRDSA